MTTPPTETLAQGRFQLLDVLGVGGMATVYRAFDRRLQRYRAIKILAPALATRATLRKRFLAEAQTMATLEESRVVRIFDMGEDLDRVYIVMELVEGGSLVDRVNSAGPLPPQLAAQVGMQIAESLHVAHLAGVIHRDIKPHNILLTKAGEIRITDFGIAQVHSEDGDGMTRTGAVIGTWGFMAPEQRSNAKGVDARADVFSTGATLWALLKGETPPELYAATDAFDDMPEALVLVLQRATRYNRDERYASALALADALREVVTRLPPDPEFVPPLVLPKQFRLTSAGPDSATIDPSDGPSAPPPGTMVPDLTPDPSLALRPVPTPLPTPAPRSSMPAIPTRPAESAEPESSGVPLLGKLAILGGLGLLGVVVVAAVGVAIYEPTPVPPIETPVVVDPIVATDPLPTADPLAPEPVADPVAVEPPVPVAAKPPADVKKPAVREPAVKAPPSTPPVATTPVPATPVSTTPAAEVVTTLTHLAPTTVAAGGSVTLSAIGGADWTLKVYYRPATGGAFRDKRMSGNAGHFTATLKADGDLAGGFDYFLQATTPGGVVKDGSAASPHRVSVP